MSAITDLTIAKKLVQIKQSADSRGLVFDMSFKETKKLMNTKICFFTGVKLDDVHNSPNKLTFDRIDNSIGYVDGNVVACASYFNTLKNNLTVEQIVQLYEGLRKKKII